MLVVVFFLFMLLLASKYGLGRAQGFNRLRIRCKILGQASVLLPIDVDLLQYMFFMALLSQHILHST